MVSILSPDALPALQNYIS